MNKTSNILVGFMSVALALSTTMLFGCSRKPEPSFESAKASAPPSKPANTKGGAAADAGTQSVEAACTACRTKFCRNFQGYDLIAGCMEKINTDFGADAGDPQFLSDCKAVYDCAQQKKCYRNPSVGAAGCYCGSRNLDDCVEKGPGEDAPCRKEWETATRSKDNDTIMLRFSDSAFPAGWAHNILGCERELCAKACGYSFGAPEPSRTL